MVRVLTEIEIRKGERVQMLFTPSLYEHARRRGAVISVEDTADAMQVMDAYTKIMYFAALNAWEVRLFDEPALGEFPYKMMDFVCWAAADRKAFAAVMYFAIEALTGKPAKDFANEVKKK